MLIFDSFKTDGKAQAFIDLLHKCDPALETHLLASQEESDKIDPFPFELTPPIVLVGREWPINEAQEAARERLVRRFGGEFAGT